MNSVDKNNEIYNHFFCTAFEVPHPVASETFPQQEGAW